MARPFFAYMLRCSDGTYYVGHTDELDRRLAEHETGATGGYTATRRPIQLVWFEEFRPGNKLSPSRRRLRSGVAGKRRR